MGVSVATRPFAFGGEYDSPGTSDGLADGVDWGTATPRNTISLIDIDNKLKSETRPATEHIHPAEQLPAKQKAVLLHGIRERFRLKNDHEVPETKNAHELVVKIQAIGLNPVDWKSVDYGFGIPTLPYVSGRDFAGVVVQAPTGDSRLNVGDTVSMPLQLDVNL